MRLDDLDPKLARDYTGHQAPIPSSTKSKSIQHSVRNRAGSRLSTLGHHQCLQRVFVLFF